MGKPHELRNIQRVGHVHHDEGTVHTDHTVHACDVIADHWEGGKPKAPGIMTGQAMLTNLAPYPGKMHVRVAVPLEEGGNVFRMLDIVMVGYAAGAKSGAVQLITESWDGQPAPILTTVGVA